MRYRVNKWECKRRGKVQSSNKPMGNRRQKQVMVEIVELFLIKLNSM